MEISYRAEVRRKALHLIALVVPLGMALLGKEVSVLLLVPSALFALLMDYLRVRSSSVSHLISRVFGFMMRPEEVPPVGGPVRINGATWVLVSAALLAFIFPIRIAVPSFVMFMICDAAAALVGRRYGRTHWGNSRRTVEGSLAFVVVGVVIFALFPSIPFWIGAVSVIVAALAEAAPKPLNDNIRVPVTAAAVIFALEYFVLGSGAGLFL